MEAKHTLGPWDQTGECRFDTQCSCGALWGYGLKMGVHQVTDLNCPVPDAPPVYAAAPELLEVVEHIATDGAVITPELVVAARAAIAKAKGE
jgi:hypothetical protein